MLTEQGDFVEIAAGIGYGTPPAAGWIPIADCPLLIVVGVTGVGKSTTIDALRAREMPFTMLPDRRVLTDDLIIARLQRADGVPVAQERDRARRFAYTRRFRERFPGGMAHALAHLQIGESAAAGQLIFDGLLGENEVGARRPIAAVGPLCGAACTGHCARTAAAGAQRCF
ncbi:MAG: hypothetical protein R2911_37165 [Caldilineaceae bacterium]